MIFNILNDKLKLKKNKEKEEQQSLTIWLVNNFVNIASNLFKYKGLEFFGEEILKQLDRFIDTYGINDLHTSNVGYIGNRPVLIDYSGYFE